MNRTTHIKPIVAACFICTVLAAVGMAHQDAGQMPQDPDEIAAMMPAAGEEHMWLKKFIGTWEMSAQMHMPGMEEMNPTGTETVTGVGDFWITADTVGDFMGTPYKSVLTIGYDPEKKKYIGTWIDSLQPTLWIYEGELNDDGTTLTLHSEGPSGPGAPMTKFREVTEFKSDDHRVFTSFMQDPGGEWNKIVTVNYHRKK